MAANLRLGMVTFDATDARALAAWWARQTGGQVVADHDGDFVVVVTGGAGPRLGFQRVEEPTPGKNRLHLDLEAVDPEPEVERLLLDGAQRIGRHESGGFTWMVLADPEGNHFCVSGRN